jgi:hypothetical protein
MFYIDPDQIKVERALKCFKESVTPLVLKRLNRKRPVLSPRLYELLNERLDDILFGRPNELYEVFSAFARIPAGERNQKTINYIFNYSEFVKSKKADELAENLDIQVCSYCNRNYTRIVRRNRGSLLTRPQFDHYFDKANYPLLAISFFNLIPCCSECNTLIKIGENFILETHLHPYSDNKVDAFQFSYILTSAVNMPIRIIIRDDGCERTRRTIQDLKFKDTYNAHSDQVIDLLKLRQAYSDKYLKMLEKNVLSGSNLTRSEIYRLAFGTNYYQSEFINKPFSKLKFDILKELGMLENFL